MTQYINKSAVVAEIEKRLKVLYKDRDFNYLQIKELEALLSFLDTLEVKEVHDIWHDVSEKPELEQPLLIVTNGTHKDFRRQYRIGCYGKRANDIPTWVITGCYPDSFISKWCYISDILQYTSEAKEVDLEKEYDRYYEQERNIQTFKLAKHFFELGLKAQQKSKDVLEHSDVDMNSIFEEIGVDPDSHIASLFKNAFYKAVDKYLNRKVKHEETV